MDLLIAILVWLGCFHANTEYTESEMEMELSNHQAAVELILDDPSLQEIVWDSCGIIVPTISIKPDEN